MIQGLVVLRYENYHFERWHGTLIYWAILLLAFLVNTVGIRAMPMIENGILVFHVATFFTVLVPLVVLSPHKSAEYVFTTFENSSGWENDGVAWFLGLLSAAYVLVGYDGACHLSMPTTPSAESLLYMMDESNKSIIFRRGNAQRIRDSPARHDRNHCPE
jgi:amino acid transporter